jgi:hypothetical protein
MPSQDILERFIARVEENKHAEALEEFYLEDASLQENHGEPRVGRAEAVAHEHKIFARAKSVFSKCVRPVFVNGDKVVIRWQFRFEWLDGSVMEMEEIAYQRWVGDKVAQEQFFYDPAQRLAK